MRRVGHLIEWLIFETIAFGADVQRRRNRRQRNAT